MEMGILKRTKKLQKEDFSESLIQKVLTKEYMTHPKYILYNLHVFPWESDFLFCTQAGYWHEVEIKISIADFKNDMKHKQAKYHALQTGLCPSQELAVESAVGYGGFSDEKCAGERWVCVPNYFSYCVPYYLLERIRQDAIFDKGYGLYFIDSRGRLNACCLPRAIHKTKIPDDRLNLTRKFYYAYNNWRERCMEWYDTERNLRGEIASLKAEYKAVTGETIQESAC